MSTNIIKAITIIILLVNFLPVRFANSFNYQLPATINDFPNDPDKQDKMSKHWNINMAVFTEMAITGNPWTNQFDYPRSNYLNQKLIKDQALETTIIDPIKIGRASCRERV